MPYGISDRILIDNKPLFVGHFFNAACVPLGTQFMMTAAYHPHINGQPEWYNKTLINRLHHYVSEHQNVWDDYVQPLTFVYTSEVHKSRYTTPFSLNLSSEPPGSANMVPPTVGNSTDENAPRRRKQSILARINLLRTKTTIALQRAQQRYKANFDSPTRRKPKFHVGD